MAYIGKTPIVGNFQKCDSLNASATADYTLQVGSTNVVPESVNHMIVSLNGVIQAPTTAYTVSGATLSFASALTSNDSIDFVILLGNVLDIGTPSDDTVATAKIQDDAVSLAKMASGTDGNIISYDTSGNPVAVATGNDGQVLTSSGAGAVCAFEDASGGVNTPAFYVKLAGNINLIDDTDTLIPFASEIYDTDSAFTATASNYKFTAPSDGKYFFTWGVRWDFDNSNRGVVTLKKNGSLHIVTESDDYDQYSSTNGSCFADLSTDDYMQIYAYQNSGGAGEMRSASTYFGGFKIIT
jgi:hypothetical protein